MKNKAKLTKGPIGKTLTKLTIPMTFGLLGMIAFNLVDTFFVGKLGINQLAALSYTFPVILVVTSIALGLGFGASAVISRAIGEGDNHKVKRLTTDSLLLAFLIVLFFVIIGLLTIKPLFRNLGATPEIVTLILSYMRIWYIGMPFVVIPMVGNNAIRATGDTKTPSAIMLVAVCINLIMDPLLIFGIGPFPELGLEGAAIATIFSRFTVFSLASYILIKREKMISFHKPKFYEILESWKKVLFIGIPVAGSRVIIPISIGIVTRLISNFGQNAVAGFGVCTKIEFFSLAVIKALAASYGPFIGQNLGAKKYDRVNHSVKISQRFAIFWGIGLMLLLALIARPISILFNKDPNVIHTIVLYLSIVPISYGLQSIFVLSNTALNVLKKPFHAAGLTILQMFILYIPLSYIGANLFQLKGVFGGISLAYILTGIISYFVLKTKLIKAEN